jgi:hypothetical protein
MSRMPSNRISPAAGAAPRTPARRMARAGFGPAALCATLCGFLPAGCRPMSGDGDHPLAGRRDGTAAAAEWPYWPRTVRIHPLTRLVQAADGSTVIELRVEFLDRFGDGTKACGTLQASVFDERRGSADRRPIDNWEADLRDPDFNARCYDHVTRTYLVRLPVAPEIFELGPVLYVRYDCDHGRVMLDRMELRTAP